MANGLRAFWYPDSTEWAIRLRPDERGGTVIEQTFEVVKAPKVLDVVYASVIPAHRDRTAALTEDLRRLGEVSARPVERDFLIGARHKPD